MKLGYLSKMVLFVKQMVLKMKLVVLIRENTQYRISARFFSCRSVKIIPAYTNVSLLIWSKTPDSSEKT